MLLKNKIVAIILSAVFALSTIANAKIENIIVFTDNDANYLKYVSGFGDGTVRPDAPLTRAQCAKMLTYVVDVNSNQNSPFFDVSETFWAYDAITELSGSGVLCGYSDGSFSPDKNITRAEFSVIITRIADVGEGTAPFTDISEHWAKNEIESLYAAGYIQGYSDNTFRPDESITRAESVKILNKVIGIKINENEMRDLFTDLPSTHWAYYEIMSAVSTIAFDSTIEHTEISFSEIEYINIDVDEIQSELSDILLEFITADVYRQAEIFNRISVIESDVAHAIAMSSINLQRDVTSERDVNNIANSASAQNVINKAKETRYKYLMVVKSPEIFEKQIGMKISEIPDPGEAAPDTLVELYMEEQQYENEFSSFMYGVSIKHNGKMYSLAQAEASGDPVLNRKALDYYVANKKIYGEIFTNLISVRTRIANFYGYRYYTDFGYIRTGKYYYTPEDISVIRSDVKKYIAPLVYKITQASRGHFNGYRNLNADVDYVVHKKSPMEITEDFLRELSPQTREALDFLNEFDLIDEEMRENKATTSFTSYITKYDLPFVFLNETGNVDDIENLCHEFGHALQAFRMGYDGITCPSDVAEISSYGMEMLSFHNYDEFFGEDAAEREILVNLYYKLRIILLSTFMDEFQYMIYKDTLLTVDERNSLYASLYKQYFPGTSFSHDAYEKGIAWSNPAHLFTEPYYSIDYTLALVVAFQLWEIGEREGFDRQFEVYMSMLESPYIGTCVHYVALYADMDTPFKKGIIESIAKKLDNIFKIQN